MKVSIVIPNYDTWDLVERNVNACIRHDNELITEIIIVDDCSPTPNYIDFPSKVRIIRNQTNLHYTETVNVGLKNAIGDILILLDSDAYPIKPFIKQLISQFESNTIGCIGFKTVNHEGKDSGNYMYFPSVYSLIAGQQIHKYLRKLDFRKNRKIVPFSCAVSFRKICLQELNYFNTEYKVLDADSELSNRIHLSSWNLVYNYDIEIYHVGGNSIPKNNNRVFLFYESRWKLLNQFKLISAPILIKKLIILRLIIESFLFRLMALLKSKQKNHYYHKLNGRKELIKIVSAFK